jgi:hypothetical protein
MKNSNLQVNFVIKSKRFKLSFEEKMFNDLKNDKNGDFNKKWIKIFSTKTKI